MQDLIAIRGETGAKIPLRPKFLIQKINYIHLNPVQGKIFQIVIGGNMRIVVQGFTNSGKQIILPPSQLEITIAWRRVSHP